MKDKLDPPTNQLAEEFWSISSRMYSAPTIERACLHLQDKFACNINILLYCCWIAWRFGVRLDTETLKHLNDAISPFHQNITAPLRTTRLQLAQHAENLSTEVHAALKRHFVSLEIQAERVEQMILISHTASPRVASDYKTSAESLALQSMSTYLLEILRLPSASEQEEIRILADAVATL